MTDTALLHHDQHANPSRGTLAHLAEQMHKAADEIEAGMADVRQTYDTNTLATVHVAFQRLVGMADAYLIVAGDTTERGLAIIDGHAAGVDLADLADRLNEFSV